MARRRLKSRLTLLYRIIPLIFFAPAGRPEGNHRKDEQHA